MPSYRRWLRLAIAASAVLIIPGVSSAQIAPESRIIASDGKDASHCVRAEVTGVNPNNDETQWVLINDCGETVDVGWCTGTRCAQEMGAQVILKKDRSWPVSGHPELKWGACYGANTVHGEKGSGGTRHYCSAPDDATKKVDHEDAEEMIDSVRTSPTQEGTILKRGGNSGADAVSQAIANSDEWERDAPVREAAARAEAARRAEESRLYAEKQRLREEKQARQASGSDGWATFLNAVGAAAGAVVQVQGQRTAAAPSPAESCNCIGTYAQCVKSCYGATTGACADIRPCP